MLKKFGESIGYKYFECSSITGENIFDGLDEIARISYYSVKDNEEEISQDYIVLENDKEQKKKGC